jgi:hypothetical protein
MAYVAPDEIDAAGFSGLMRKAALSARLQTIARR